MQTLNEPYRPPLRASQVQYMLAASLLMLGSALFGAVKTGYELAPQLEGLKQANPAAHAKLADGTYDTLSLKERYEFVLTITMTEDLALQARVASYMDKVTLPPEAREHVNAALLKMLLTYDMTLRQAYRDTAAGTAPCESLRNMVQLYQLSFDIDLLPELREAMASQGTRLDCDF